MFERVFSAAVKFSDLFGRKLVIKSVTELLEDFTLFLKRKLV